MSLKAFFKTAPLIAVGAAIWLVASPVPAHAQGAGNTCEPLPKIAWWPKNHAAIEKYVARKYKGDWKGYTRKWMKAYVKLSANYIQGKAIYLKSQDLRIEGKALRKYIDDVERRINVTKCLAEKGNAPDDEIFASKFDTKGGSAYACKPVPEVAWWGDIDHDRIRALVKRKHRGNWKSYIEFWEEEREALLTSFNLGQEAQVNKLGLSLSNEELALYVIDVNNMIATLNCLADDAKKATKKKD